MPDLYDSEPLLELDVPDGVPEADQAVELIRAWVADGALAVTLNDEALGPHLEEWGRVLAEISRHIARTAALRGEVVEERALKALRNGFNSSFSRSTLMDDGKLRKRVTH